MEEPQGFICSAPPTPAMGFESFDAPEARSEQPAVTASVTTTTTTASRAAAASHPAAVAAAPSSAATE